MKRIRYFDEWMAWFVTEQAPNAVTCERVAGPFVSEVDAQQAAERLATADDGRAGDLPA